MILLFQTNTSYNPLYSKLPLPTHLSDSQIWKASQSSLYNKYSFAQNYYYTNDLNMILAYQGRPGIHFKYDQEFFDPKEYLTKYHSKEIKMKLKKLIQFHQQELIVPRHFLEPITLDLIVDKNVTKKKKLQRRVVEEKLSYQYSSKRLNQFNSTRQFIKKKLLNYDPILKDLNDSRPTTLLILEQLETIKQPNQAQFMLEMEKHHKQIQLEETKKITQFDHFVEQSKFSTNISGSTRLSTTRPIFGDFHQNNYDNYLNQRINLPQQKRLPKPPQIQITNIIDQVPQIQSTRAVPQNQKKLLVKPYLSPKAVVAANLNFRKVYSNLQKYR